MIVKKTTTRSYEITKCVRWETTVGEVIETRKKIGKKTPDLSKCFSCGHKFAEDEYPYLAIVKGTKNQFLCTECAKKVEEEE